MITLDIKEGNTFLKKLKVNRPPRNADVPVGTTVHPL
jgi:hypothetical protein